jgi:hypothetical protein
MILIALKKKKPNISPSDVEIAVHGVLSGAIRFLKFQTTKILHIQELALDIIILVDVFPNFIDKERSN